VKFLISDETFEALKKLKPNNKVKNRYPKSSIKKLSSKEIKKLVLASRPKSGIAE
jgi:hypothetical protein